MAFRHTPWNVELTTSLELLKLRSPKTFNALDEFEEAVRVDEFKGGGHPADFAVKERDYDTTKLALVKILLKED